MADGYIVTLDIGSSSVRALLYDSEAGQMEGYGAQLAYELCTTPDGGVEIDPDRLFELTADCLDEVHRQVHSAGLRVQAVAASAFWHSFLGVDASGRPTFPILHLLDTRSAEYVPRVPDAHQSTGCPRHTSYWPAKLLWLADHREHQLRATARFLSFPEYLFVKLFGRAQVSTSMMAATGLWNQAANDYDAEMLTCLPLRKDQLPDPAEFDQAGHELLPEYQRLWPAFDGVPWLPAIGDGAANHIGSGCLRPGHFSLMAGTTGAMRAFVSSLNGGVPQGLFCYRFDRDRLLMGGALSNAGDVYAWLKRTLISPKDLEARLEQAEPGSHNLAMLPFLAGERSPYWRGDLYGVIAGLTLATEPFHIVHAALESVALRFREIYDLLAARVGAPAEIIASGAGLLRSRGWTQIMADALGHEIAASTVAEASSRGAALHALGALLPAPTGTLYCPRPEFAPLYDELLSLQRTLYHRVFE